MKILIFFSQSFPAQVSERSSSCRRELTLNARRRFGFTNAKFISRDRMPLRSFPLVCRKNQSDQSSPVLTLCPGAHEKSLLQLKTVLRLKLTPYTVFLPNGSKAFKYLVERSSVPSKHFLLRLVQLRLFLCNGFIYFKELFFPPIHKKV